MRRPATPLAAALLAAAILLPAALSDAADDGQRVLTGRYTSGYQDRPANLRAVFTPDGIGGWKVVFHFSHAGQRHQYRGEASGDLVTGSISGRVQNEGGSRTFTFRCEFDDKGRCEGRHFEIYRGREHETGKLTLR